MSRWTERQLARALRWIEDDLGRPSKDNQYQMQVALETRRVFRAVLHDAQAEDKLEHFRLRFGKGEEETSDAADYPVPKADIERQMMEARLQAVSMAGRDGRIERGVNLTPMQRHEEMLKAHKSSEKHGVLRTQKG